MIAKTQTKIHHDNYIYIFRLHVHVPYNSVLSLRTNVGVYKTGISPVN